MQGNKTQQFETLSRFFSRGICRGNRSRSWACKWPSLFLTGLCAVVLSFSGCGPVRGVPAANVAEDAQRLNEQADAGLSGAPVTPEGIEIAIAPGQGVAGRPVDGQSGQNDVSSDPASPSDVLSDGGSTVEDSNGGRPAAKTGLVHGLTQMLNSTPLQDDQKDSIRSQMEEADNILHSAKKQNQEAIRQAFRQVRVGPRPPHIIMIVADDLRISDLKCYGASEILTPNIDRLARTGTRMTRAYAGSPDSRDARWCLVAGRRPDQALVRNQGAAALKSEDLTVAEVMWQAGYTTAVFGHWGVMAENGPADPDAQGYDQWLGTYGPPDEPQHFPEFVNQSGNKLRLTKNANGAKGQFVQDFYVAEASEFLSRTATRTPVFLQFFFSAPGSVQSLPKQENYTDKPWPEAVKTRAAAITRMDRDLGKLIQRLDDLKQLGNTVFILTTDTPGESMADATDKAAGALQLRGHHGELYEGGLRVPLILSGTPRIPSGLVSPVVTAAWDLPPTIFQLASVAKVPRRRQGQSLLVHLKPQAVMPERFLRWELNSGTVSQAVLWKDWKAIHLGQSASWELYDLKQDPSESQNVSAEHSDVMAEILARLPASGGTVAAKPVEH